MRAIARYIVPEKRLSNDNGPVIYLRAHITVLKPIVIFICQEIIISTPTTLFNKPLLVIPNLRTVNQHVKLKADGFMDLNVDILYRKGDVSIILICKQFSELFFRNRPAVEVTLGLLTICLDQERLLFFGLHSFGYHG